MLRPSWRGELEIGQVELHPVKTTFEPRFEAVPTREELARRYLVPAVQRILTAKERFGTVDWEMETDRGVRKLTTRNLRENVQRPAPGRIILSDVDGNRYDIRNIDELDLNSQQLLFQHL